MTTLYEDMVNFSNQRAYGKRVLLKLLLLLLHGLLLGRHAAFLGLRRRFLGLRVLGRRAIAILREVVGGSSCTALRARRGWLHVTIRVTCVARGMTAAHLVISVIVG